LRTIATTSEAARRLRLCNADFAGQVMLLNFEAARAFSGPDAMEGRIAKQIAVGQSAMDLYLAHFAECAALIENSLRGSPAEFQPDGAAE
jgi:hypothetical protein